MTPVIQNPFPASAWNLKTRAKIIPPRFPQEPTRPEIKPCLRKKRLEPDFGAWFRDKTCIIVGIAMGNQSKVGAISKFGEDS